MAGIPADDTGSVLARLRANPLNASICPKIGKVACDADDCAWTISFAHAPERKAAFAAAGTKVGLDEERFRVRSTAKADEFPATWTRRK